MDSRGFVTDSVDPVIPEDRVNLSARGGVQDVSLQHVNKSVFLVAKSSQVVFIQRSFYHGIRIRIRIRIRAD